MKPISMKIPGLQQVYCQRMMFNQHKKKLQKIKCERKHNLSSDQSRLSQIKVFKQARDKAYISKMHREAINISKQNFGFVGKLENVRSSIHRYSVSSQHEEHSNTQSYITPFKKKQLYEAQKQNLRISKRMRSMSSSLNPTKLNKDYQKSLLIKKRIMHYTAEQNKVALKSQKYFQNKDLNQTSITSKRIKTSSQMKPQTKNHYNYNQIVKNKVDSSTNSLWKIRRRYRPITTQLQQISSSNIQKNETFFPTQPQKLKDRRIFV